MNIDDSNEARPIYHVPVTTAEFQPDKPADLLHIGKSFQRHYWTEMLPFMQAISGEGPSITGHPIGDEWKMTFTIKKLASDNGYAILAERSDNEFRQLMRRAYRSNTHTAVGKLIKQAIHLRIEDQRTKKESAETETPSE